jgi:hypothetical protein
MKTLFKTLLLFAIIATLPAYLKAQDLKIPQPSTAQTITQAFGLGTISINYSRPNVKGRKIFGGLEPYGTVWRTGANSATTITTTEAIKIEGKELPAGTYELFTIPGENEWTIIINKGAKQWGAYEYKADDDVFRVSVRPVKLKDKVETFTIQVGDVYPSTAKLQLMWENTMISMNLTTDIDTKVMASIDAAMQGEKKPYFAAAMYYYENGKDLKKALEWATAAEASDPKATYYKLWKGRIQLKMGDKKAAAITAAEGIKLAEDAKMQDYVRLNSELLKDTKK